MALQVKDANAVVKTLKTTVDGSTEHITHHNIDTLPWPTLPTLYAVALTLADTQYSQELPANCARFAFHARTNVAVRFAFATGLVATPTDPYQTLKAGENYASGDVLADSLMLYFAAATAGTVVEIEAWS